MLIPPCEVMTEEDLDVDSLHLEPFAPRTSVEGEGPCCPRFITVLEDCAKSLKYF